MPVVAELVNHDEIYYSVVAAGIKPVIINDLPYTTERDKEEIRELTITQLTSDTISIIPTCGGTCKKTRGKWALGRVCTHCGNVVRSIIDDSAKSLLWMRAPEGIRALISPVAWQMLSSYFTKNNHDAIQYLTDSAYAPTSRRPAEMEKLDARNHERDLNYFIDNFDDIIEDLMMIFPEKNNRPYADLRWWIKAHRDCIFTKYQPLPSKNLFITDKTILGIYMEDSVEDALDTIYHFVSIDLEFYDRSPRVVANRTARVLARQAAFFHSYISSNFQPKPGHLRRHVFGSRSQYAGRGVISSVTGDHRNDEVHIPWRIAIPMHQHALMGKLMRYGYNFNGALGYLLRHVAVYDELMHEFTQELFDEAHGGRGPVHLLHRNPTLQQGSMQRYFGKLKTDPSDPCIGMSILTVVAPNADKRLSPV